MLIHYLKTLYKYNTDSLLSLIFNIFFFLIFSKGYKLKALVNFFECYYLTNFILDKMHIYELNILISFLLSDCMGNILILNIAINKLFKNRISKLTNIYSKENPKK